MKKFLASTIASVTFLVAAGAFAAPPASGPTRMACSHCAGHSAKHVAKSASRAALYGLKSGSCRGGMSLASAVRWGNAQKPCPDCGKNA